MHRKLQHMDKFTEKWEVIINIDNKEVSLGQVEGNSWSVAQEKAENKWGSNVDCLPIYE
jgi:hypothetical protein